MCVCVNLARAGPLKIPGNGVSLYQDLLYLVRRLEEQPETGSPAKLEGHYPSFPSPLTPLGPHIPWEVSLAGS